MIFNQIDISENKFADFFVCVTKNNNFVRLLKFQKTIAQNHVLRLTFLTLFIVAMGMTEE